MADPRSLRRNWVPRWPLRRYLRWRYLWVVPTRRECQSAYYDLRAWLAGWCNQCPFTEPGEHLWEGSVTPNGRSYGYTHWRCEKALGHLPPHRFENYSWGEDRMVAYNPTIRDTLHSRVSPWAAKHVSAGWKYRMSRSFDRLFGELRADSRLPDVPPDGFGSTSHGAREGGEH